MPSALDLHLTEAQLELYERTRALAAETLKPIADAGTPGRGQPPAGQGAGRARAARSPVRARGRRQRDRPVPDPRGAGPAQHRCRDRVRAPGARRVPDRPGRHAPDQGAMDPPRRRRQRGGGVRADRARGGLGPGSAVAPGRARRRRRLPTDRREAVDLERPRGRHLHGVRAERAVSRTGARGG